MKHYAAVDNRLKAWQKRMTVIPSSLMTRMLQLRADFHYSFHSSRANYLLETGDYQQAEAAIDSAAYYEGTAGNSVLNLIAIAQQRSQLAREQGRIGEALRHSAHLLELARKSTDSTI